MIFYLFSGPVAFIIIFRNPPLPPPPFQTPKFSTLPHTSLMVLTIYSSAALVNLVILLLSLSMEEKKLLNCLRNTYSLPDLLIKFICSKEKISFVSASLKAVMVTFS